MQTYLKPIVEDHYKPITIIGLLGSIIISYFSIVSTNEFTSFLGGLVSSLLFLMGIWGGITWYKKR